MTHVERGIPDEMTLWILIRCWGRRWTNVLAVVT